MFACMLACLLAYLITWLQFKRYKLKMLKGRIRGTEGGPKGGTDRQKVIDRAVAR